MKKSKVLEHLKEHQSGLVEELEEAVRFQAEAKDLDEEGTLDPEDFSHQVEQGDMEMRMRNQLSKAKNYLHLLDSLPNRESDVVSVGALVETDSLDFVIGIPTVALHIDEDIVMGVSSKAPIYRAMRGKKAGDEFSYGKRKYLIKKIS